MRLCRIKTVISGVLLMFAYYIATVTAGYFIDDVSKGLGCTRGAFALYVTIMAVSSMVVAPLYGKIFCVVDIRKVLFAGGLIGLLSHFSFAWCDRILSFYLVSVVFGTVQNGCTLLATTILISRVFAEKEGTATGISMAGSGIGGILLSTFLPTLIEKKGYAAGYFAEGIIWAFIYILVLLLLRGNPAVAPIVAENKGVSEARDEGVSFQIAVHSRKLYALLFSIVLTMMAATISSLLPSILSNIGFFPDQVGRLMGIYSLSSLVSKILVGKLFDCFGGRITLILVHFVCAVSALLIIPGGSVAMIGTVTLGFGVTSGTVLMPLLAENIFGKKDYTRIWSYGTMANVAGVALGTPAWGIVHDSFGTYTAGLIATAILMVLPVLALVGILAVNKPENCCQ